MKVESEKTQSAFARGVVSHLVPHVPSCWAGMQILRDWLVSRTCASVSYTHLTLPTKA